MNTKSDVLSAQLSKITATVHNDARTEFFTVFTKLAEMTILASKDLTTAK